MKISTGQIKKIIREEMSQFRPRKSRGYNSMSDSGKALAGRAKRVFLKDYPGIKVGINTREGWITVDGKKAVNLSSASSSPMSLDVVVDRMKQAYLGHPLSEGNKMKITKRQLKRIIKEEYSAILGEDTGAVNAIIDDIQPDMEKMSKTELDLLSMNLDRLIAQLGGSKNEAVRIIRNRLKRIIREERNKVIQEMASDDIAYELTRENLANMNITYAGDGRVYIGPYLVQVIMKN